MNKILYIFKFGLMVSIHQLPEKFINFWQVKLLKNLIMFSYENVPIYKKIWSNKKLKIYDFNKISDLQNFPIINKKTFQKNFIEECIGIKKDQYYKWGKTSGSTGEPFIFISTRNYFSDYEKFNFYRFLYWCGYSIKDIQKNVSVARISSSIDIFEKNNKHFTVPIIKLFSDPKKTLIELSKNNSLVLQSYPSVLVELSRLIDKFPDIKLKPKFIFSYGENLTQKQRVFIEDKLNGQVVDRYGSEEFGAIGTECKYHKGFHINCESLIVEILDVDGAVLPSGKVGRIIITDLRNYAMPFIRYDTGDLGYIIGNKCKCGLEGGRLIVNGRAGEIMNIGDKRIHHMEISKIIKDIPQDILQYQIKKKNEKNIIFFLVIKKSFDDFTKSYIKDSLKKLLPDDCDVSVEVVNKIKRERNGKCRIFVYSENNK